MKKLLVLLTLTIINMQTAQSMPSEDYFDYGIIYTNNSYPTDIAKNINNNSLQVEKLKQGEAVTHNILGLVEIGDRSIDRAAKNGGIKNIHYIDTQISKVYIPIIFIPIYVKQIKTIVYGE